MAEERKDSFAETVDTAASAAHTVKGAIKAGKAISGAAKGAAAGGPYGAVAGAVWAGRKHIGKIIAVIIILLLLPVLFVLMLPGLIFGGLINAFSPADTEQPVLNSETAIVENANDITFTINSILGEALDDVMARIEADFASSGADQMEVKNPYSSGPVYNANLIISQYCAARDEDFESISLDDLADIFGGTFPSGEFDTLGGFVFNLFGKIPVRYEKVSWDRFDFIIQAMDGHRITTVKIMERKDPEASA